MSPVYEFLEGTTGLLISMPHNGEEIPEDIASTMTPEALAVPDTDWYKDKLYDFAQAMGAYIIKPKYSRYVIDLNRDAKDTNLYPGANSTELCPTTLFDLSPMYQPSVSITDQEKQRRLALYWQPYHDKIEQTLAELKQRYARVVMLDAHSILSRVPRFFEGQLPDFNFGNNDGASCDSTLLKQVEGIDYAPYTQVSNARFKGGFITRNYGNPAQGIHTLQLELSQRTYMNESTLSYDQQKADKVKVKLEQLVQTLIAYTKDSKE